MLLTNQHPHKCHLEFYTAAGYVAFRHNENTNISPEVHQELLKQKAFADHIENKNLKSPPWNTFSLENLSKNNDDTIINTIIPDVTDIEYLSKVASSKSSFSGAVQDAARKRLVELSTLASRLGSESKQTKGKSSD
jgi:hypothetical protein